MSISRICIFCGASPGHNPVFTEKAAGLGREMAERGLGLVYGGGSQGVMGAVARAIDEKGGSVTGVLPRQLRAKELSGEPIGRLELVDSMHERKARMSKLADAFLALPGGFGTIEETFETITWIQLGIHRKPIGLLNIKSYFDPILEWIENAIEQGFIREHYRELLVVDESYDRLLDRLLTHTLPPSIVSWSSLEI